MFKKIKMKIRKLLEQIAKENKNSYGNKKIDCCDLNKSKKGYK